MEECSGFGREPVYDFSRAVDAGNITMNGSHNSGNNYILDL